MTPSRTWSRVWLLAGGAVPVHVTFDLESNPGRFGETKNLAAVNIKGADGTMMNPVDFDRLVRQTLAADPLLQCVAVEGTALPHLHITFISDSSMAPNFVEAA